MKTVVLRVMKQECREHHAADVPARPEAAPEVGTLVPMAY